MSKWGDAVLKIANDNPDVVIAADANVTDVTPGGCIGKRAPLTPDAAQWLAKHPAPSPAAQAIVLPLPPSANRYWRNYNGVTVTSDDAKAYKAGVWLVTQHASMHPFVGAVALYIHVYRKQQRGDLDNYAKVLTDALIGCAYMDDDQVTELHMWRHDDKANPRVEVEIRQVTP